MFEKHDEKRIGAVTMTQLKTQIFKTDEVTDETIMLEKNQIQLLTKLLLPLVPKEGQGETPVTGKQKNLYNYTKFVELLERHHIT